MSYSPASAVPAVSTPGSLPVSSKIATPAAPARKMPMMRRYEVAFLDDAGQVEHSHHVAPANAIFEGAFSAFARGTLIATTRGQVAIEDLLPGDEVLTAEGDSVPAVWIGSMTLFPNAPVEEQHLARLTRVTSGTFGPTRPGLDLMVGPGARMMHRPAALRDHGRAEAALTPLHEFTDGFGIIQITPPTPVTVYHLCLSRHAIIKAAGLEVESYHPGHGMDDRMGRNLRTLFLSLFPHVEDFADFGPLCCPRTSMATLQSLSAA